MAHRVRSFIFLEVMNDGINPASCIIPLALACPGFHAFSFVNGLLNVFYPMEALMSSNQTTTKNSKRL